MQGIGLWGVPGQCGYKYTVLNFPPKCDIESENDQNFVLNKKVNISKLEVYTKTIEQLPNILKSAD